MKDALHPGLADLSAADAPGVDRVCDAFEAAWRSGQRPRIEDFGQPDAYALLCELVGLDVEYRRAAGERPAAADYLARFPVLDADWLTRVLAAPVAAPGPAEAHRRLGRFDLLAKVGQGACGAVWRAYDPALDRVVALKVPHPGLLGSPEALERFRREAQAAARLRHPGIVAVHDVAAADGTPVLVQDFLEGESLRQKLAKGRVESRTAADLVAQAAEALDYAHREGAVHRDVKPANVMVTPDGRAVLVDFGLALQEGGALTLTADGQLVGTPAYMSPEQAAGMGHLVDARTDVYALGVVLYELLTGRPPFQDTRATLLLRRVVEEEPRPPRWCDEAVPRDLDTVCLKAMAKEPRHRYPTAGEFAADLRRFLAGEPVRARPTGRPERVVRWVRRHPAPAGLAVASAVAALALVAVGVGWSYNARLDAAYREAETANYFQRLALASREWAAGNVGRVEQLLAECPEPLRGWEWRYLRGLTHKDRFTLVHRNPAGPQQVADAAYSPDGSRLATADHDGLVRIWNPTDGRLIELIRASPDRLFSVAWHPDGRRIATGDVRGRVAVWDVVAGAAGPEFRFRDMTAYRVAFSPDGRSLAAAAGDGPWETSDVNHKPGEVRVWDLATGRTTLALGGLEQAVTGLAFHPSGSRLATAEGALNTHGARGQPGAVTVWDAATGDRVWTARGHDGPLTAVAYSPDGSRLATGGWDRTVVVWDAADGGRRTPLNGGHRDWVRGVAFGPDGRLLASAGADARVVVWDVEAARPLRTFRGHTQAVNAVAFRPDGLELATVSSDRTAKTWNPAVAQEARVLAGAGPVSALAYTPDGRHLVMAGYAAAGDRRVPTLTVWDAVAGTAVGRAEGHADRILCVAVSPDGRRVASGGRDRSVRVWDIDGGALRPAATLAEQAGAVRGVAFRPGEPDRVAAAGIRLAPPADNFAEVRLWDVASGRETGRLSGGLRGSATAVAYSPDGALLAVAGQDQQVVVWDAAAGREVGRMRHARSVSCVAFSPDGRWLATGSQDYEAAVWDVAAVRRGDPGPAVRLRGHTRGVFALAYSPDGTRLASGSEDATVKLWDPRTGQEALTLTGHTDGVTAVAFAPDGRTLASAGGDGTVRLSAAPP